MILTDDECRKVYTEAMELPVRNAVAVTRHIESAILDKLRQGVELPGPYATLHHDDGYFTTKQREHDLRYSGPLRTEVFTRDQLLAYGAAQRLAGREQVLKEATDLDWTAIMCEGCLVTWENAETLGCHAVEHIRALAASPQEQT